MLEQRLIAGVPCDFLSQPDFLAQCAWWLTTNQLHHVVTLNPEMVMQAQTNADFRKAVAQADLRVPDGAGLIWARWYLRSDYWSLLPSLISFMFQSAERITGVDTVRQLAKLCLERQQPLYLLGGTSTQVEKTAARLRQEFPHLTVFTSPSHAFSLTGPDFILSEIIKAQPAVLLVAYGSPQQTLWIEKNRANLPSVRIAIGVGGAFAMLSEDRPRAPQWLRHLNLEWLWRLVLEPRRLPRIWQAAVKFPALIKQQKNQEQRSVKQQ